MVRVTDWDDAYTNGAYVPGAGALPDIWAEKAAAFRAKVGVSTHAYGATPREEFDLVLPTGPPKGLVVFVHGGYWMKFARSDWTHLAQGARAHGWAVAIPSYTLAPHARIAHITQQIGAAIIAAASLIQGPIRLAGHSAGGQLVARMICKDTPLGTEMCTRLQHVMPISGVHDLRPLMRTKLNDTLQIDPAESRSESPAFGIPLSGAQITAWVGGAERPEFLRQTQLLAHIWARFEIDLRCVVDDGLNHFNVIDGLCDPASPITRALLGDTAPLSNRSLPCRFR